MSSPCAPWGDDDDGDGLADGVAAHGVPLLLSDPGAAVALAMVATEASAGCLTMAEGWRWLGSAEVAALLKFWGGEFRP